MDNPINLVLRALQFLWTLLIMALTGNMIAEAIGGNASIVNYCMFVAVISMLALFYLFTVSIKPDFAILPILPLVLDALLTLFFLIGGIALAAELNVHSCSSSDYLKGNHVINGSKNQGKRCHEAQAVCAFLWFGFAAYMGSLVFSALGARGGSMPGRKFRGGAV
ncbi:non-classical export protein [Lasallia pustulata]|uniref:Non-classical export protein n=1 Tax=Lasallia pustulata TaxID=136370 RepID=A0A1W5D075_9LECA|nr:non-classical export protein [Lasallia pustulata]